MIYFSHAFTLQEIQIYRKDGISNIEQAYRSVDVFRWKKIYTLGHKDISTRLQRGQNSLKYITIQKQFPRGLKIYLESYKPLFRSGKNIILENGSIIEMPRQTEETLPKIYFSQKISGQDKLNHIHLKRIENIWNTMAENIQNFQILLRIYYMQEEEVLFLTQQWNIIVFDLGEKNIQQQEKLKLFLQEKRDIDWNTIVYLDLRVDGKVYLCSKEEEYSCKKNIQQLYGDIPFTLLKD